MKYGEDVNPDPYGIWFIGRIDQWPDGRYGTTDHGYLSKDGQFHGYGVDSWTIPLYHPELQYTSFRHAVQVLKRIFPKARLVPATPEFRKVYHVG